jgi:hypothetical protein
MQCAQQAPGAFMASHYRLRSGQWRAQFRRAGHSISRTFKLKANAKNIDARR